MALNNANGKTAKEKQDFVNAQIQAGNTKYLPKDQWLARKRHNDMSDRMDAIEKKLDAVIQTLANKK